MFCFLPRTTFCRCGNVSSTVHIRATNVCSSSFVPFRVVSFRQLVDEARKQEGLLWYTSVHPDTPLHTSLPLNTAVVLPISLTVLRRDLCFVFFAEDDVNVSRDKNKYLVLLQHFVSHIISLTAVAVLTRCIQAFFVGDFCGTNGSRISLSLPSVSHFNTQQNLGGAVCRRQTGGTGSVVGSDV